MYGVGVVSYATAVAHLKQHDARCFLYITL